MKPYFLLLIFLLFLGPSCELVQEEEPESPEQPEYPEDMVFVEGGTFNIGCTGEQRPDCNPDEYPARPVTLGDFYIGRYEVTFDEYDAYARATGTELPDDEGFGRLNLPVGNVSWFDVLRYCNWRSEQEGLTPVYSFVGNEIRVDWRANGYRLPTEAEWEFAARGRRNRHKWAGTSSEPDLVDYANVGGHDDGYEFGAAPVGQFKPNELGLYDMTGNIWEWCWDMYNADYYDNLGGINNPKGPAIIPRLDSNDPRVLRGGGFTDPIIASRVSFRGSDPPNERNYWVGFRLARN